MRLRPTYSLPLLVAVLVLLAPSGVAPARSREAAPPQNPSFGLVFVNAPDYPSPTTRYTQGKATGAGASRWPVYWHEIETSNGQFDFSRQDAVVNGDLANGFATSAILMGVPGWMSAGRPARPFPAVGPQPGLSGADALGRPPARTTAAAVTPAGGILNLYAPVFLANGAINPSNYWARFVYTTVTRYKDRIKIWEIWNEPDLKYPNGEGVFWTGSTEDYYQLLKVGYLATKAADPSATVLFAGLAYFSDPTFFPRVLDLMAADPTAPGQNYYFDVLPWHFYSSVYNVYDLSKQAMAWLQVRGLNKRVWINETNLPVCSDPADPAFTCPQAYRGTPEEQANFVIEAFAEAAAAGVERLFLFQLYDDGLAFNAPEFYGLIRNDYTTRPAHTAYAVAATYLSARQRVTRYADAGGTVERIVFDNLPKGPRVTVLWNRTPVARQATVPAYNPNGFWVSKSGAVTPAAAAGGVYTVNLPGATNPPVNGVYHIGGDPFILVEQPLALITGMLPLVHR